MPGGITVFAGYKNPRVVIYFALQLHQEAIVAELNHIIYQAGYIQVKVEHPLVGVGHHDLVGGGGGRLVVPAYGGMRPGSRNPLQQHSVV